MDKNALSFHEWEQLFLQEHSPEPEFIIESEEIVQQITENHEQAEAQDIEQENEEQSAENSPETPGSPETPRNEALIHLKSLCRVCSSQGFINISSHLSPRLFQLKASGDMRPWQVPIAKILAEVSGEKIEIDDGLAQFICQHCLGYLQHAYGMRLKIKANQASLEMMKTIATNESIALDQKIDIKRVTKREVEETKEEEIEEGHLYEVFRNSSIQINSQSRSSAERIIEQKCGGCNARLMSVRSLNNHTRKCEKVAIDTFFTSLNELYSSLTKGKITNLEFIHRTFKLIFDAAKDFQRLVRENGINVKAVLAEQKMSRETEQVTQRLNFLKRTHSTKSPDYGYSSSGSPNLSRF